MHTRSKSDRISVKDLSFRVQTIIGRQTEVIRAQLKRNGITIFQGTAEFADAHTIEIQGEGAKVAIHGDRILMACGTRPAHNPEIPFDGKRILDTDQLSQIGSLPKELIVVGAGVVALEYAPFFAALGVEGTLCVERPVR